MGKKFLIDTNVIIDFQVNILPKKGEAFVDKIINENFTISFISYIEYLGYANVSETMKDFISLADIIKINRFIINETIFLRKTYRIKLPDAIIASTAIANDLTLITHNTKDFEKIKHLKLINPYNL